MAVTLHRTAVRRRLSGRPLQTGTPVDFRRSDVGSGSDGPEGLPGLTARGLPARQVFRAHCHVFKQEIEEPHAAQVSAASAASPPGPHGGTDLALKSSEERGALPGTDSDTGVRRSNRRPGLGGGCPEAQLGTREGSGAERQAHGDDVLERPLQRGRQLRQVPSRNRGSGCARCRPRPGIPDRRPGGPEPPDLLPIGIGNALTLFSNVLSDSQTGPSEPAFLLCVAESCLPGPRET